MSSTKFVVVRTESMGAFAGYLESRDGTSVVLSKARRLWYWAGAASLSEMAVRGVSRPTECKFPAPIDVTLFGVGEIIDTTEAARASIEAVPEWTAHAAE
jgi:hypothetical protein